MKRLQGFTIQHAPAGVAVWHEPCRTWVLLHPRGDDLPLLDAVNAARAHECSQ